MITSHIKLSFGARGLRLYTLVINLMLSRWSFNDWYGATEILVVKVHFALTIALYEIHLSYRLFKKFKTRSTVMFLDAPINDSHCLIYMLYLF